MAKTLDEILAENDALAQQAQLREYLANLTKDGTKLASMSLAELQKENRNIIKVLQEVENKTKTQKSAIIEKDKELNKSYKKLNHALREANAQVELFDGTVMGSLAKLNKFGDAVTGAALVAVAGFKGVNLAISAVGAGYDNFTKPIREATAGITTEFGAATDASGNFVDSFSGRLAAAEVGAMDLIAASARGQLATDARFRQFSSNFEQSQKQIRDGQAELRKSFQNELFAIQTGVEDVNRSVNLMTFQKILGATGEQMGDLAGRALIMGTSIEAQSAVATRAAQKLGKAFGVEAKVVARTANELRSDFRGFGTFTEDQLAKVAAQTRKLGLSLEGIKKLNMFDDFDKAAESAAMLGQSFGLNIDAFDLFMEEDPTERLRMIQEAASQAGLDIANMSRVEMNYLSDLTGMGVEDTMKALSDAGMDMQSQLGDVPDVAQTAQEQTKQLIEAQAKIGEIIEGSADQIAKFPDSAADIARNLRDVAFFQEGGPSRLGTELGNAFENTTKEGLKLALSEGAKEVAGLLQRGITKGIKDAELAAAGALKVATATSNVVAREMKAGRNTTEALAAARKDPAVAAGGEDMLEAAARTGAPVNAAVKAGLKGVGIDVDLTGTKAQPPAKPKGPSASAAPSAAADREVTAEARRDAQGNLVASGQDMQTNQTIKVILNVDGKLLSDTVLEQQMTNQPLPASSVGGNIRNNATA
jgi:hypothetical protein